MDARTTSDWEDKYKINIAQIDVQHRMLLKLIDTIHEGVESRIEKSVLKDLLVELAEFTRMHFWIEEQLMIEHDYPDLKKHHKEHKELLEHLNDLVTFVSNAKHPTFYSDYDISSDWALVHIAEQDPPELDNTCRTSAVAPQLGATANRPVPLTRRHLKAIRMRLTTERCRTPLGPSAVNTGIRPKHTRKHNSPPARIGQILQWTGMKTPLNQPSIQVGLLKNSVYPIYSHTPYESSS